jgi:hypothetical protein
VKFKTSHARSVSGNNIVVSIEGERNEQMIEVQVELDGFTLADDSLQPPSQSYENNFSNAGDAGPLMEHKLVVTATTSDNVAHGSTTIWTDPI